MAEEREIEPCAGFVFRVFVASEYYIESECALGDTDDPVAEIVPNTQPTSTRSRSFKLARTPFQASTGSLRVPSRRESLRPSQSL